MGPVEKLVIGPQLVHFRLHGNAQLIILPPSGGLSPVRICTAYTKGSSIVASGRSKSYATGC